MNIQNTHPELHDLTALAYDMIEGTERDKLLEHLAECNSCRDIFDSYRDEQALVRDVIVEDARSGPAEAAALQKTLSILAELDGESEAPKGKLIKFPALRVATEVAAVAVVAVGLFLFLKPSVETSPETALETVADSKIRKIRKIAEEVKAPVEVNEGTVLVGNDSGEWQAASAIPADEWVMVGGQALSFTQANGSRATASNGTVFRISVDETRSGEPMIYLLHGDIKIDASSPVMLQAGNQGHFYALAGSEVSVSAVAKERNWASDSRLLRRMKAQRNFEVVSQSGSVFYMPLNKANRSVVMHGGERLKVGQEGSFWYGNKDNSSKISIEISLFGSELGLLEEDGQRLKLALKELEMLRNHELEFLKESLHADMKNLILQLDENSRRSEFKKFTPQQMFGERTVALRDTAGFTVIVTVNGQPKIYRGKTKAEVLKQLPEDQRAFVVFPESEDE
ncbi:MAG: hypothetical protein L3J82_05055 [Planctomycetes bacterium]|nr:hypothetical protein [Planctomycetota bacterium]